MLYIEILILDLFIFIKFIYMCVRAHTCAMTCVWRLEDKSQGATILLLSREPQG